MFEQVQLILGVLMCIAGGYAAWKHPKHMLWIPPVAIILGQLSRLPLGSSRTGILVVDLIIPCVVGIWFLRKLVFDRALPTTQFGTSLYILLGVLGVSLLAVAPFLPREEILSGGLYYARFASYMLLFFLYVEAFTLYPPSKYLTWLLWSSGAVGVLGILQFIFVPDFTFMAVAEGWDPHIGRLLSTWYDPNFVAGFFAFIIGLYTAIWVYQEKKTLSVPAILMFLLVCFLLTYSRSGIVALGAVIGVIGLLKARTLIVLGIIGLLIGIGVSDRFAERFMGLVDGAIATATGSLDHDLDATSQERVASWEQVSQIVEDSWVLGVGFNTIKYHKISKGLVADPNKHSASGSDSSLLNFYITAGVCGLMAFLYLFYTWTRAAFLLFRSGHAPKAVQGFGLGMFACLISLFLHSFFVNSLLYPLFLLVLIPCIAILDSWYTTYVLSTDVPTQPTTRTPTPREVS